MNKTLLLLPVISLLLLPLAGCNKEAEEVEEDYHDGSIRLEGAALQEAIDYRDATAAEYYAANPDFFKSGTDLPEGLDWQDGSEQAEFTSPEAKRGGVETILVPDYPRTFRFVGDDSSTSFRSYIHDDHSVSLVKKHPETGGYYTGLAEKWAISEDKKTVFFKLDPNAKFSDNVPVRTNHFKYTFYFMRSKWINAPWYNNWYSEKYTHLTVYDDLTFSVGLKDAKPDSLRFFEEDLFPKPEHFYKDFGEDYLTKYGWRFEPTTGPYIINRDGIKKGRSITQSRLDDWWANDKRFWRFRYNPDQRKYVVTKDPDKALESFIAGNYDMYRIRTPDVWGEKLDKPNVNKGYIVRTQYYNQVPRPCYSLRINKSKPHLDNRDVREGLQYATNFESVLENYFRGLYQRMESSSDGYGEFSSPVVQARRFSPEIAREYFAKAGFDQTGPDGILMNAEGQRLSFTITTGYRRYEDVLAILKQEALKAGVEYRLEIQEATAAWKKVQEKKH
ncbi:MAG: ABC transporter substrate-binding protein, partial [Verrucomicrobiota bacterium]